MDDLKVIFVGCNPSPNNTTDEPFVGSKSGKTLSLWLSEMDLVSSQCGYVNLTDKVTKKASDLKKKDVNIQEFWLNLLMKALTMRVGQPDATKCMIAKMQQRGQLAEAFGDLDEKELDHYLSMLKGLEMPAIVTLGKMAAWGVAQTGIPYFELPHPSGLNRKTNDKEALKIALADCKAWLYSTPEESTKGDEDGEAESDQDPEE